MVFLMCEAPFVLGSDPSECDTQSGKIWDGEQLESFDNKITNINLRECFVLG